MENQLATPISLRIVAVLFFLGGLYWAIEALIGLTKGSLIVNAGVLGLFVGVGLLRYSCGWRTCALVMLLFAMIWLPLVGVVMLAVDLPFEYTVFGRKLGKAPKTAGVAVLAVTFAFFFWQYWVLTRPRVRRLFGVPD